MNNKISVYFFFLLLLIAAVAAIVIFLPFLTPLVLGAAASVAAYPLHRFFLRSFGLGRVARNFAALATVVTIIVVILVPIFFLFSQMYSEIQNMYASLIDESGRSQVVDKLNSISQSVSHFFFDLFPVYNFDSFNATQYLKGALIWAFGNLDAIFSGFAKIAIYLFIFLISLFYFLRDGAELKRRFIMWSPLLDQHDEYITVTLKRAIRSVFAGTIVVAVVQGILTGFGFWIFGIPAASVWGSVAAISSMIPGIGTALVIVPGIVYLLITGETMMAIGLALWGLLAVGLVDNFLGPYMVNRGVRIHPFLILISVLGGLVTFGAIGFVMGPLILAFLFALLEIYRTSFTQIGEENRQ